VSWFNATIVMTTFELSLTPSPTARQLARDWVRLKLRTCALEHLTRPTELLLSELVANLVRHVCQPMAVRVTCSGGGLRVEVDDPSDIEPVVRKPTLEDDAGRGLLLVAAIATEWGADVHADNGKTVWFELGGAES
jgi:anti-sigma regulatory factor (Ser/Thr protein kinase)